MVRLRLVVEPFNFKTATFPKNHLYTNILNYKAMHIKSLDLVITELRIISDIDDCLFLTSKAIREKGLNKKSFWFNKDVYEANKDYVFNAAELTDWGREFVDLVKNGFKDYILITAAGNRLNILASKLGVASENIIEDLSNDEKVDYLNGTEKESIYVDDKLIVIRGIINHNIIPVNYPKRIHPRRRRK